MNCLIQPKKFFKQVCYFEILALADSMREIFFTCDIYMKQKQCGHVFHVIKNHNLSTLYHVPLKTFEKVGLVKKNTKKATLQDFIQNREKIKIA